MQFSAFTSFGFFAFSGDPSLHEQMYDLLPQLWGPQHDMTQVGSYEEAKRYMVAGACAVMLMELNHAGNQANPLTAYDLLPLLENDFLVAPGPTDTLQTRQNAVAAGMLLPGGAGAANVVNALRKLIGASLLAYLPNPAGHGNQTVVPSNPGNGPGAFKDVCIPAKLVQLVDPVAQTGQLSWVAYQALDLSTLPTITWSPAATFSEGQLVLPSANANGFYFVCSADGVTGTTEPIWPSVIGETVVDGTVTWTCASTIAPALLTGDVVVVDAGNTSQMEKVTVVATSLPTIRWTPGTKFAIGQQILPSVDNGFVFVCQVAGTTGATEPVWPTSILGTVVDGGVTWICISTLPDVTPGYLYMAAVFFKSHDIGAPMTTGTIPYWWSTQRLNLIVVAAAAAVDAPTRAKLDRQLGKMLRGVDTWAIVAPANTTVTGGTIGPFSAGMPMGIAPLGAIPFNNSN